MKKVDSKVKKKQVKKNKKVSKVSKKAKVIDTKVATCKYPSPIKNSSFVRYWSSFIVNMQERVGFNGNHLKNLEILCQLYIDYDSMTKVLNKDGFSYLSVGRNGTQIKARPEAGERSRVVSEIRHYSKMLGIVLDPEVAVEEDPEKGEWD